MNEIHDYLSSTSAFDRGFILEKFVLRYGSYNIAAKCPAGVKRQKPKLCFMNAAHLAIADQGRYVEGFGFRPGLIPLQHAWCIDHEGKVIDNTWPNPETCQYFGVVVDNDLLMKELMRTKVYGVLSDHLRINVRFMREWIAKNGREPMKEILS